MDTSEFLRQHLELCWPDINRVAAKVMDLLAEEGLLVCEAREVLREVSTRLEFTKLSVPQERNDRRD